MTTDARWLRPVILLGVPLVLAVLLVFHPWPYDDYLGKLIPIANWWATLHIIQFVLLPLAGYAVWLLTSGLRGRAVIISRFGAVIFAIFYSLGDALAGVGTGLLAQRASSLPPAEQTALAAAIGLLFRNLTTQLAFRIGVGGWVIALAAAAIALYRAGAPRLPLVLLAFPAILLAGVDHARPYGALAFGFFFVSAWWIEGHRQRAAQQRPPSTSPFASTPDRTLLP